MQSFISRATKCLTSPAKSIIMSSDSGAETRSTADDRADQDEASESEEPEVAEERTVNEQIHDTDELGSDYQVEMDEDDEEERDGTEEEDDDDDEEMPWRKSRTASAPRRSSRVKAEPRVVPPAKRVYGGRRKRSRAIDVEEEMEDKSETEESYGEEEEENSDESESEYELEVATPPSDAIVQKLNTDSKSQGFPSLLLTSGLKITQQDAIELRSGHEEPWLGKVVQIRALKSDLTEVLDENGVVKRTSRGDPIRQSAESFVQIHWLYTKKMLKEEVPDKSRYSETVNNLGEWERLETDHADWYSQTKIKSSKQTETVYRFDDTFPNSVEPSDHPLKPFRQQRRGAAPPLVFFGDNGPGSDATPYVRTTFDFNTSIESLGEDSDVTGGSSNGGKRGKGKRKSVLTMPKAKKARRSIGLPLIFNLHSLSCRPYNPRDVQVFSRRAYNGAWFNVADLDEMDHVAPLSRSIEIARVDLEEFSDDDDEDEKAEVKRSTPRQMRRKNLPPALTTEKPRRSSPPTIENDTAILQWILGKGPMVRGGAYGLIGNSAIMFRAQELVREVEGGMLKNPVAWHEEVEEALLSCEIWQEGFEARKQLKGYAISQPPLGKCWVCPVTGDKLS